MTYTVKTQFKKQGGKAWLEGALEKSGLTEAEAIVYAMVQLQNDLSGGCDCGVTITADIDTEG